MIQKLVVALLALTVTGATGVGVYEAVTTEPATEAEVLLASSTTPAAPTATIETSPATQADPQGSGTGPVEQVQALSTVGDPWAGSGVIAGLETSGMTLVLNGGEEIFVELGPAHYWQNQGVTLAVGDSVNVSGFFNGEQYHAAVVTTADGAQLVVRSEIGEPLWSGGAEQNGNGNTANADQTPTLIEWITLEGQVVEVTAANALTLQTADGATYALQLGTPDFINSQGITFAVGDAISVLGYWQGTTFKAGEVTKTATGERLMLLDPNGRPLWSGPGRVGSGQGSGQSQGTQGGQGGQGQGQSQGQSANQGQGTQGNSNITGGGGNGGSGNGGGGNGYRGGRG